MFHQKIKVKDIGFYCKVIGSKIPEEINSSQPTMIILHGGPGGDHSYCLDYWSRFADLYQIIFFDQRGCGQTDWSSSDKWNLKQWGEDLHDFIQALHLQQKPVIGAVSFGGHVALSFAAQYPNDLSGMVLSDTEAHMDKDAFFKRLKHLLISRGLNLDEHLVIAKNFFKKGDEESIQEYFQHITPLYESNPEMKDNCSNVIFHLKLLGFYHTGELFQFDFRSQLKVVNFPVLYFSGDVSPYHCKENALETAGCFQKDLVKLLIYEGAGSPVYNHKPEETTKEIKNFLHQCFF